MTASLVLSVLLLAPPSLPPTPGAGVPSPSVESPPPSSGGAAAPPAAPKSAPQSPTDSVEIQNPQSHSIQGHEQSAKMAPASEVEVELPLEFSAMDPRMEAQGPQRVDSEAEILEIPEEEPEIGLPGDQLETEMSISDVDEMGSSSFENFVSVRTAVRRDPPQELTYLSSKKAPERTAAFLLGYRQFSIQDGLQRRQDWHTFSLEISPLRRYARLNFITEVGFEGGEAAESNDHADLFVIEKLGLGIQYPHWVSPFLEFQVGIGAARVELFERNDLAMVNTLGVDGGAQWAVAKHLFLLAAVGWIRPYFSIQKKQVYYDRVTFKVGLGF